jgi:ribonuclease BN (tRNA processing enzyme)
MQTRSAQLKQRLSAEHSEALTEMLLAPERRLLLLGQPGIGKTTLAAKLAMRLSEAGRQACCLAADPGTPAFGLPGAVNLGVWRRGEWHAVEREALCSFDAARFRLPLIEAVSRLAKKVEDAALLIDTPGVVRGVAGAELLTSLVRAAGVDLVAVLVREGHEPPLDQELKALAAEVVMVQASASARRPSKSVRDRLRTRLWDTCLAHATEREVSLSELRLLGTPPRQALEAWLGKQVAFLDAEATVGMGEVVGMTGETLKLLLPPQDRLTSVLLVRDAVREESGQLMTGKRFAQSVVRYLPPSDLVPDNRLAQEDGYRPMVQTGSASAVMMNGVFGDPLLHMRLAHQRRSLLFDLGEGARLPTRVAHQISDVFISHAHMDHICGFLWLLRSRIGESASCRLYGPPGLATQIEHLINGIHWDRVGDRGPRFEVAELHGDRLLSTRLQAGKAMRLPLGEVRVRDGVLRQEAAFRVRAVTLDHGIPVLAYAFEPVRQINVRKERLKQQGLEPGPWLTELKQLIVAQKLEHSLDLPNGHRETVRRLAADLTLIRSGSKIVYATDLADIPGNRERLIALAEEAHTLFCESPFMQKDAVHAQRTGHLTTAACAEIARAARVRHLIPFHFSRRYEEAPLQVYDEIAVRCPQVVVPSGATGDDSAG